MAKKKKRTSLTLIKQRKTVPVSLRLGFDMATKLDDLCMAYSEPDETGCLVAATKSVLMETLITCAHKDLKPSQKSA